MSGRDYRTFVTFHRAEEMDKLVRRMSDGIGSNKYYSADYSKLKMKMAEQKFSGHKTLLKVQKLEEISKQNKENNVNKQHGILWHKEFLHLNQLRKKVQAEIDAHIRENMDGPLCHKLYQDFEYYKAAIESDFDKFRLDTAVPVWNLREDLTYWMSENKDDLALGVPSVLQKHQEIMCTIDNVKQQQADIVDKLNLEQRSLECELKSDELRSICPPALERRPQFQDGIPEEAFDLECPNQELKLKILEEFLLLDQKYHTRLAQLDQWHEPVLRLDEFGSWNEEDHFTFVAVYDQYPNELPNRRTLLINRLKRHLPSYTRNDLVEHEDWWVGYKYYNERQKAIYSDWQRDRRELLTKARVIFAEVCAAHELEELQAENRHKQKELCDLLYNKVCDWRNQKLEAMYLETQFEEQRLKEMEERWKNDEQKEKKKRHEEKQKLDAFHEEKEKKRKLEEEKDRKRLADLHQHLMEQALIDKQRVKYREDQMQIKMEERERMKEEKIADDLEKERRLEALREQVRVIAESDPDRVMKDTEAWHCHVTEDEDDYMSIQKPLFEVNTFTSNQITSDHRVRLEQKLRDAGLHTSDYARQVIAQAKPPTVPRKDMESTVFKQDKNPS
ncbi:coiled-coil domain-containing protein 148-like [Gigantopelta aegis]|uniref:coiled-coil domain-containing protein 148-like n=1 Tax=Gigantopelta aegis TaxID=1735272 RepID=UPI001B88AAA3|nr:coiled-coil domain-containing protein 148-like [Gigantopelta aegis]XP_041367362.1 coiled-coil domain-containing protein 148-like [Gigantopelta aegis]XP_041367363.1 coiled-coil domain-containing protein 148-like [Gigantopelta aegis]